MSHAETCPLGGCGNCKLIDERDTLVRDLADARERLRVLTQFVNRQSCVVCRQPFDANVPRACPRCAPIRAAALAPFADAGVATCPRCAAFLVCEQHAPPAGAAPNETAIPSSDGKTTPEHHPLTAAGCTRQPLCSPRMTQPWAHDVHCPLSGESDAGKESD